jgi:hypothetical protein
MVADSKWLVGSSSIDKNLIIPLLCPCAESILCRRRGSRLRPSLCSSEAAHEKIISIIFLFSISLCWQKQVLWCTPSGMHDTVV